MASFVYFVDGLAGTTQRALAVANRLIDRDHSVVVSSPIDLSEDARRAGVEFVHLTGTATRRAERAALDRPGRTDMRPGTIMRWLRAGRRLRAESLADREIEDLLTQARADLALVDHEFHTAGLACRAAGQPFVLVSGLFSIIRSLRNPPLSSPLNPLTASESEIDSAWAVTAERNAAARRKVDRGLSRLTASFRPVQLMTSNTVDIGAFARSRGLRLSDEVTTAHWLRPFTLDRVDTISFTPSELEWAPADQRWRTAGLVSSAAPIDRSSLADRSQLDTLLQRRQASEPRPLVYASVGTFWSGATAAIRLIIDALGQLDDVDAVVGLGGLIDPDSLTPAPNVTLLSWAPQGELLQLADVAIVHGGVTTLGECVLAGIPMVMTSTHTNDQDGNVARAVAAGIGVAVDHRSLDAPLLAQTIRVALDDVELHARIRTVSRAARDESADDAVARLLERLTASQHCVGDEPI